MSDVKVFTQTAYDYYLERGFVEASSEVIIHKASKGRYIHLKKELSPCSHAATTIGCIVGGPLLVLGVIGSMGLGIRLCFDYRRYLWEPTFSGVYEAEGYVKSMQLTKEMFDEDFRELGTDGWLKASSTSLAESGRYELFQSKKHPHHKYFSVEGPISRTSYLIVLPNGNSKKALSWAVCNTKGKPCNAREIKKKAEEYCRYCGPRKVFMVDENSPLIQTDSTDDGLSIGNQAFNEEIV